MRRHHHQVARSFDHRNIATELSYRQSSVAEANTEARIDWPTVMVVGAGSDPSPAYLTMLENEAYTLARVATATDAGLKMAGVMPHVVILSPAVPMPEHRVVHETAIAVGAIVLMIPDEAHPALVRGEVEEAMTRASKRRWKTVQG